MPTSVVPPNVGGPASTVIPMEDQLLRAMSRRWTSDVGTFEVADDGVAQVVIRSCPLRPGNDRFGFSTDCEERRAQGRLSVGAFSVGISDPARGDDLTLGAYVDGAGQLHLGNGKIFQVQPGLQVTMVNPDVDKGSTITVSGDTCTETIGDQPPMTVPCQWTIRDGYQVLAIGDRVWIYDPVASVIASPEVAFSTFHR